MINLVYFLVGIYIAILVARKAFPDGPEGAPDLLKPILSKKSKRKSGSSEEVEQQLSAIRTQLEEQGAEIEELRKTVALISRIK